MNGTYDHHSHYSEPRVLSYLERQYFLRLPEDERFEGMKKDLSTLADTLNPIYLPSEYSTLAEQVFGHQARQQRLSLKHIARIDPL